MEATHPILSVPRSQVYIHTEVVICAADDAASVKSMVGVVRMFVQ